MSIKTPLYPEMRRFWKGLPPFTVVPEKTALLIIDMQHLTCHPDFGIGRQMQERGLRELANSYYGQIEKITANISQLLGACREAGIEIAYSQIAAGTDDSRDLSHLVKHHGLLASRSSKEQEILPRLTPSETDLVLPRTTLSVFTPWLADQLLKNMGISTVIIAGVLSDASVASTARDAGDRGYDVVVVGDACAALTEEDHWAALETVDMWFGHVVTTEELINALRLGEVVA